MPGNITSANAVIMIGIGSVFPIPVQLQGFSTDNVFDTEEIELAETSMGVDGFLSSGFVFVPVPQTFHFQADSPACDIFDAWIAAQRVAKTVFKAGATISLPALGRKWVMINGTLARGKIMPDAQKVLRQRSFRLMWESATPTPI